MTVITIGMLAWNEEDVIGSTLKSLMSQTLFQPEVRSRYELEIVVVPNGCSDATARVASETLENYDVASRVIDIRTPGKANAWNECIHTHMSDDSEVVIMVDADIQFANCNTLSAMVEALLAKDGVVAVSPSVQKTYPEGRSSILRMPLSRAITRLEQKAPALITGMLYAAKADELRRVYMPLGMLVEDGYLKAMLVTDGFRQPEDLSRIQRVGAARILFEPYLTVKGIYLHQKRIVVGTYVNSLIFKLLRSLPETEDRKAFIQTQNERDPEWLEKLVDEDLDAKRWWVLSRGITFKRFGRLKHIPPMARLWWLPLLVAATIADVIVCVGANRQIRGGRVINAW